MGYNLMFAMENFSPVTPFQTINADLKIPLLMACGYFYSFGVHE